MLLCSFVGVVRLSLWFGVVVCNSSNVCLMLSGVKILLSDPYLFFVVIDGLLGVVLCFLLLIVCLRVGVCHSLFVLLLLGGRLCSDAFMPSRYLSSNLSVSFL